MVDNDILTNLSEAASSNDVELGKKIIDSIGSWESMQLVISTLERCRAQKVPAASYLLGDINARYENWVIAIDYYIEAAMLGLSSGFYLAARITQDRAIQSSDGNWDYNRLIAQGAADGHVWSQLVILRAESSISFQHRFKFSLFRTFIWPMKILVSAVRTNKRDRVRH